MITANARERFKNAVGILADEKGGIKERLMIAYTSQLSRIDPNRELPDRFVSEFDGVKFTLTTHEVDGDRGTVTKELKKISDDDASRIARRIFDMFLEVHDLKETNHEAGIDRS
jgi:hypothetical protein